MNRFGKEILGNSQYLSKYLTIYGKDTFKVKEDILILTFFYKMLERNRENEFLTEDELQDVFKAIHCIRHRNPKLRYCHIDYDMYYNQYVNKD